MDATSIVPEAAPLTVSTNPGLTVLTAHDPRVRAEAVGELTSGLGGEVAHLGPAELRDAAAGLVVRTREHEARRHAFAASQADVLARLELRDRRWRALQGRPDEQWVIDERRTLQAEAALLVRETDELVTATRELETATPALDGPVDALDRDELARACTEAAANGCIVLVADGLAELPARARADALQVLEAATAQVRVVIVTGDPDVIARAGGEAAVIELVPPRASAPAPAAVPTPPVVPPPTVPPPTVPPPAAAHPDPKPMIVPPVMPQAASAPPPVVPPAARPRCAVHPAHPASAPCVRCARWLCAPAVVANPGRGDGVLCVDCALVVAGVRTA